MKKLISLIICIALLSAPYVSAAAYQGVDIYHGTSENGQINWSLLSKQKQFVYIKSSEGEHTADNMFFDNMKSAKSVGMKWGAYHFLRMYSLQSAKKQADFFWSRIKGTGYNLIPSVDCESYDGQETAAGIRACIRAFVDEFYKVSGIKPVIYCNTSYANDILRGQFTDCKLWQADYRGYAGAVAGWKAYCAWQYSENGKISSIANNEVDLDVGTDELFTSGTKNTERGTKSTAQYGVYTVKKRSAAANSIAGADFNVYDKNGNLQPGRQVYKGDRLTILSINYDRQLAEVEYPVCGGYVHAYIHNLQNLLHNAGYNKWRNGSTSEPVYSKSGKRIGTIYPYEKATVLDRTKNGRIHVLYSTAKGSETKDGYVHFGGVK